MLKFRTKASGWFCAIALSLALWTVIILTATKAFGKPLYEGHDLLAAQSPYFKLASIQNVYPMRAALGTLDGTFGYSVTSIFNLIISRRISFYRVHLFDYTCVRNRSCHKNYFLKPYTPTSLNRALINKNKRLYKRIEERTKVYCTLINHTKLAISPFLEHALWPEAMIAAGKAIKKACPQALLVNSPCVPYPRLKGFLREHHGYPINEDVDIVSLDGADLDIINLHEWKKQTDHSTVRLYWDSTYNCRKEEENKFTTPPDRIECLTRANFTRIKKKVKP